MRIKEAVEQDRVYQKLLRFVQEGFPLSIRDTDDVVRPYFNLRNELSRQEGIVIINSLRIVIPKLLRSEVLKQLHASHQGIEHLLAWNNGMRLRRE